MQFDKLLIEIESLVEKMFQDRQDPRLLYHNVQHTRDVVSAVITICGQYSLDEKTCFPIISAAWFHDIGYLFSGPENHEKVSAVRASEFLTGKGVDEDLIKTVSGCIMATKVPQQPHNLSEQIICDADLFHFGKPGFLEKSRLLKLENELFTGKELSGTQWREVTIGFLTGHTYFTDFAIRELAPQKEKYLAELQKKQAKKLATHAKADNKTTGLSNPVMPGELSNKETEKGLKKEKIKSEKDETPTRGVETLFRLTSKNHMDMSAMADSKAGIMISVNSIIISVIITLLMRKLEDNPHLVIPTIILLLVNICTIIFSVLATRPKILGGQFTQEDIDNRKINLLFFGHFHRMSLEAYQEGIKQMLADKEYLYSSLVKDIYYLGVVLGRKYRYLRVSYTIFMYGLIMAVAAFSFAIWFNQH
jgi:Family of unknown function (DUF5706)